MKNYFFAIILIMLLVGCQKTEKESISDYTVRDSTGKNSGNIDTTDWTLYAFDQAPSTLQTSVKNYFLDTFFLKSKGILTIFKTNTSKVFIDSIAFYSNPMIKGGVGFFKIQTSFWFQGFVYALQSKKSGVLLSKDASSFTQQYFLQTPVQSYEVEDKSFTLIYGLFSKDSVLYIGKGDVMLK